MGRNRNGYFGHTGGQLLLSVRLAEDNGGLGGFPPRAPQQDLRAGRAFGEFYLSPRTAAAVDRKPAIHQSGVFFRHPLSVDQRKTLGGRGGRESGFHYQDFVCDLNKPLNL